MYHTIEQIFEQVILYCVLALELAGVVIILITAVRSVIGYLQGKEKLRMELAEGISLALLFKMGGEVLRTVIVRTWSELAILGAIIVLRGLLTFLLHWEIKNEKRAVTMDGIATTTDEIVVVTDPIAIHRDESFSEAG